MIARLDAARELKFEYEPARTCAELRTMCADHEALPEQLRASLRLVEEDVPVVVPPNDESLLKAVNFSVLKPGATENRVAATNDELKLIVQHCPGATCSSSTRSRTPRTLRAGSSSTGGTSATCPTTALCRSRTWASAQRRAALEAGASPRGDGRVVVRLLLARVHEQEDGVHLAPADATADACARVRARFVRR